MDKEEYNKIKNYNYEEYCNYLQDKYGKAEYNYYKENWVKDNRVSRTKEGLVAHHKMEDKAIMLSNISYAKINPYGYQKAENIIYCDYLEHLLLHILICENPKNENPYEAVGIGGIINFIVPELNDVYSGWKSTQNWRLVCHEKIINDKEVYMLLLKRFIDNCKGYPFYTQDCLFTSFNDEFGLWDKNKNEQIFKEIKNLY